MQESFSRDHARRAAARDLQHGPRPAGLLPVDPRRRPRRLPPHRPRADGHRRGRRAHPARVPPRRQVAQPVLVYGDYLLAHIQEAVDVDADRVRRRSPRRTGRSTARSAAPVASRIVSSLGFDKAGQPERRASRTTCARSSRKQDAIAAAEVRVETGFTDDAETVIVAFGPPGKFVRYVVQQLRAEGEKIGYVRPITLWPFPHRRGRGGGRGRGARRRVRALRGPDDRRRPARRARTRAGRRSSAASPPTAPASASDPCSTPS